MNSLKQHLLLLTSAIFMLGMFASCNDTPESLTLSISTTGEDVVLSGVDLGKVFTIESNIAAPTNMLIKLVASSPTPDLCYFITEEVTLPMGATKVQGKIIFKSSAVEALGDGVEINVNIESGDTNIQPSSLKYNVKYTIEEKPVVEDIIVSITSNATETAKINGTDVPVEIEVSIDKESSKDIIVDLYASRALTSRYTLSDDNLTIKAGETTATTKIIFHNNDFIYTSSRADVKVDIECKAAKVSPTANTITVSATGTTPITIPSSATMSDNNNEEITIDFSKEDRVRLAIWNIEEPSEEMVFMFEVIGAEYGTQYVSNFDAEIPTVIVPKYLVTDERGQSVDFYVTFHPNAFATGTHKVTLKATIISGPARFGGAEAREVTITNVTLIK